MNFLPWLRRLPVWLLPLMLFPVVIGGSFGSQDRAAQQGHGNFQRLDGLGVGLLLTGLAALLLRRRNPVAALAVVGLVEVLWSLRAYTYGPVVFPAAVVIFSVVLSGHRLAAWLGTYGTVTGYLLVAQLIGVSYPERGLADQFFPVDRPTLAGVTIFLIGPLVVLLLAELVRIRSERLAEAEKKQRERERRRASDERLRIARELHDVLAHNISMISVQAGVALHLMDERPDPTWEPTVRSALAAIKDASKEALTEMRSVIGVLRQQDETAPRSPAAGLDRLPELVARARAAGLRVHTDLRLPDEPLPAGVDLAAFRIVQESLTNVTRHAGPGPVNAWVRLRHGPRGLSVQVDDDGRGAPLLSDQAGNGLPGMRERAVALGGEFTAGPRSGGGFRVTALLPLAARPGPDEDAGEDNQPGKPDEPGEPGRSTGPAGRGAREEVERG